MTSKQGHSNRLSDQLTSKPWLHPVNDNECITNIARNFHFDSWQAVLDFVEDYGISINMVAENMHLADTDADMSAFYGIVLGIALALKIRADDPSFAAFSIARGLEEFTLPGSKAYVERFAEGYGRLASFLLQKGLSTIAVIGRHVPDSLIDIFLKLANHSASIRGREWNILLVCGEDICEKGKYRHAEVEFINCNGHLRVSSSTAANMRRGLDPVLYEVTTVEEGIAVLDFEKADLCIALSGTGSMLFEHPIAGIYVRKRRKTGGLARVVAVDIQEQTGNNAEASQIVSSYMIEIYADAHIRGIGRDAKNMKNLGFPEIGAAGALEAIMIFSRLAATAGKYK
jgi:tetrahydromethanopterin S-methyltransferase subunit B